MMQASVFECLEFDPFSGFQDGLCSTEVNICGREVGDAFMIADMVVVTDEGSDLLFEITRQIIILKQDAVFEGLMPAPNLALGLRVQSTL